VPRSGSSAELVETFDWPAGGHQIGRLVALLRAGAAFVNGELVGRPTGELATPEAT
jgi:hypothetical protein